MNITKIEITNVKGISNHSFNFVIYPNKPNILVAPNGFGKSSFATAFESLKSNKIELDDKNYHNKNVANRPSLKISLTTGNVLEANDTQNTINDLFDVFVINNQTEPKAVLKTFGGHSSASPSLDITPTVLISTIPQKIEFDYSSTQMKADFGANGSRILINITSLLSNSRFLFRLENEIDFSRFGLKPFNILIEDFQAQINQQQGTGPNLKTWIQHNYLASFQANVEFKKFSDLIISFGFPGITDETDSYLTAWQLLNLKTSMAANFKKACKYVHFLAEKEHYANTLESFNPVRNRFDIKPKIEGNSLIVRWPKAHEISNGQRDILTFIALLLKCRRNFKKSDCILVIDEIFDYMDDANLISFQYYISTFIDDMKRQKRRIFPVLLTHLDPLFFNHFCFNDSKINVNYIKEIKVKSNQRILRIIYNRTDTSIQDNLDAYFFHYHPNTAAIDLTTEFTALKLNLDWAKPDDFFKKINREVRRYLYEDDTFDPIAICFGVRVQIEKLVYSQIPDALNQQKFIDEIHGTKNKLLFAQSIGVDIPEIYFLLGIIYNTSLHLFEGQDISKPLGLKLENGVIKKMIENIFR